MHNVPVNGSTTRAPGRTRLGVGLAAVVLGLTACSGGSEKGGSEDEANAAAEAAQAGEAGEPTEATAIPTAEPYLPVPDGVELTPQGSLLEVGEEATVAYKPRQGQVGVLGLTVQRLRETTFEKSFEGWQLDARTRRSTPYFVDVKVTNEGRANLGGRAVPLYLLDDANTLIEASTFAGDFKPCASDPLPQQFRRGDTTRGCLVFLAPQGQELAGVSFRPNQDFEAITWAGEVERPGDKGAKRGGKNKKSGSGGGNGGGGNS